MASFGGVRHLPTHPTPLLLGLHNAIGPSGQYLECVPGTRIYALTTLRPHDLEHSLYHDTLSTFYLIPLPPAWNELCKFLTT